MRRSFTEASAASTPAASMARTSSRIRLSIKVGR
jgi:hypothetical protein